MALLVYVDDVILAKVIIFLPVGCSKNISFCVFVSRILDS